MKVILLSIWIYRCDQLTLQSCPPRGTRGPRRMFPRGCRRHCHHSSWRWPWPRWLWPRQTSSEGRSQQIGRCGRCARCARPIPAKATRQRATSTTATTCTLAAGSLVGRDLGEEREHLTFASLNKKYKSQGYNKSPYYLYSVKIYKRIIIIK